jgi:uncharacterized protein
VNIAPIHESERITVLDVLRGLAVFGILLLNMRGFSQPLLYLNETGQALWPDGQNQFVDAVITMFGEGKFYSMFSFLFGLGVYLFISRIGIKGQKLYGLYFRRMTALLLFGLLHALLLWWGDILVMYAIGGFLLIAFYSMHTRTLLNWMIALTSSYVFFTMLRTGLNALIILIEPSSIDSSMVVEEYKAKVVQAIHVYHSGSWFDIYAQRLEELKYHYNNSQLTILLLLTMFLAGMYAGKKGWFNDISNHLSVFRKAHNWGLFIGLPLSILLWISDELTNPTGTTIEILIYTISMSIGIPAMSIFYIASIVLWHQRKPKLALWHSLSNVGRMALSNYLGQSVICTFLFYSYGLGLYGKVSPAESVLITLAIFGVQLILSAWWLKRFRFGPMEWVWRSITYFRIPPMK